MTPKVVVQVKVSPTSTATFPAPVDSGPKGEDQLVPVEPAPAPKTVVSKEEPPKKTHYLTDLDPKSSANGEMPRGQVKNPKKEISSFTHTDPDFLTPDQWRFEFHSALQELSLRLVTS